MSFDKNGYKVIKNVVSKELLDFVCDYFTLKSKVYDTMIEYNHISPYTEDWGTRKDEQVLGSYSLYGDPAMETLLEKIKPVLEKHVKLDLVETYSYARIYHRGKELKRHKDRDECEISTTLNLGGDPWPIFIEPDKTLGAVVEIDGERKYLSANKPGIEICLKPGDMLAYKGCELEHWREPFEGNKCLQVFLHYNSIKKFGTKTKYEKRHHLGLPRYTYFFKKDVSN